LQRFDHYLGDPGHLPAWVKEVERVSAADVKRVVSQYLSPAHRVTVVTLPQQSAAGGKP
jgi:predicted Zn-dependent peptidase